MNATKPTYIVAVSGGIDSVVLLHMLMHNAPELNASFGTDADYVVAHVNHGIRGKEADEDAEFVSQLASAYGLEYFSTELKLGPETSEEQARDARYAFLEELQSKTRAKGIILAHHQGDVVETAVINMLRGTGRRGLSSLKSTSERVRPILHLTKDDIVAYAQKHKLTWREDSTNLSNVYLRNKVRSQLRLSKQTSKDEMIAHLARISEKNDLLDKEIATVLQYKLKGIAILSRSWFVKLPHLLACEIMHALLVRLAVTNISRDLVERLVIGLKVGKPGTRLDIDRHSIAMLTKRSMRIVDRETLRARKV